MSSCWWFVGHNQQWESWSCRTEAEHSWAIRQQPPSSTTHVHTGQAERKTHPKFRQFLTGSWCPGIEVQASCNIIYSHSGAANNTSFFKSLNVASCWWNFNLFVQYWILYHSTHLFEKDIKIKYIEYMSSFVVLLKYYIYLNSETRHILIHIHKSGPHIRLPCFQQRLHLSSVAADPQRVSFSVAAGDQMYFEGAEKRLRHKVNTCNAE